MRRTALALCLSTLLLAPATAQTYDELQTRATKLLEQHERKKGNGVTTPWSEKDAAFQAGDIWIQAAALAPTDERRFHAYEQAGLAYSQAQTLGNEAREAYRAARDIASISPVERARMGLEVARRERTFASYEFVANLAGASPEQKGQALEQMANSFIVPAKADPSQNASVVKYRRLAAAEWAKVKPSQAEVLLGMASVTALEIPDLTQAVAALDAVSSDRLALLPSDEKLGQAMRKISWADGLARLVASVRAVALWKEVGGDATYPVDQRVEAWTKLAEHQGAARQIDAALAAYESAYKLRSDNFVYSEKLGEAMIGLLDAAERPAPAEKVVARLAAHPAISAPRKEQWQLEQARRLFRLGKTAEGDKLLSQIAATPRQGAETIYQVKLVKAQALLDKGDSAGARAAIDAGLVELGEANQATQFRNLQMASGNLYQREKQYLKAFEAYSAACRGSDGRCQPSEQLLGQVEQTLASALQDKQFDQADAIVNGIASSWNLQAVAYPIFRARLAVARGDGAAGRQAIAQAREAMNGQFYGDRKVQMDKLIVDLERQLP